MGSFTATKFIARNYLIPLAWESSLDPRVVALAEVLSVQIQSEESLNYHVPSVIAWPFSIQCTQN